jgi:hypothetical protein
VAADRPFYSGKHKMHGMNLQVISSPDGNAPTPNSGPGESRKLRCCPHRAGRLAKAIHLLQERELAAG